MGAISPTLRAALRRSTVRAHFVLELEGAPTGTARLARTREPVSSRSLGHYDGRANWGRLSRTLSGFRGALQAPTFSVDVDDTDGRFRATYGVALRGLRAVFRLVCPDVPPTEWATLFVGVVDRVSASGSKLTLAMRQADDPLSGNAYQPQFTRRAWPHRDVGQAAEVEQLGPVVLGRHDAFGYAGDKGMLEAVKVDTVGFRYWVSADSVADVLRVYSAGALLIPPAYEIIRGYDGAFHACTLLKFADDQADKAITLDVVGVTSSGNDAEAAAITAPAEQLKYLLTQRTYNSRRRGPYLEDSAAPVSSAHFAALDAYLADMGHQGSYYLGTSGTTGQKVLQDFLRSFEADAFFTAAGHLAVALLDHRMQNDQIYFGPGAPDPTRAQAYVLDIADSDQPSEDEDAESVQRAVVAKAGLRRAGTQTYLYSRAVRLPGERAAAATLELPWAPSNPSTGSRQATLYPIATAENNGWGNISGAPTAHEAVDDPEGQADGDTTRITTSTTAGPCEVAFQMQAMPPAAAINSIRIVYRSRDTTQNTDTDIIKPYVLVNGVRYYGPETSDPDGSYQTREWLIEKDPSTNAAWTQAGVDAARYGLRRNVSSESHRLTQLYAVVDYYPATDSAPAVLEAVSRRVRRYRAAPRVLKVRARLDALDLELGDLVAVSWQRRGWGRQPWQRRLHRLVGVEPDARGRALTLSLEDVQDFLTTLWLQGAATGACVPYSIGDGVALVTHGGEIAISRATAKYVDDAAGEGIQDTGPLVKLLENVLPCDRHGVLVEGAATNLLPDSSFKRGLTGWTVTPGPGGATIAPATGADELLFEPAEVSNVLEFVAGAPHTGASVATATTTGALLKNSTVVVQIVRWDVNGEPLAYRLQRGVDNLFWNATTGAWQAAVVDNLMPFAGAWATHRARVPIGAAASTLTLSLVQPAGGTPGRRNLVGHAQLEAQAWGSSPIVTQATAVPRAADVIAFANDHAGVELWPRVRGSWEFELTPQWNAADVLAGTRFYVCSLAYGAAANAWELYYQVGLGWVFLVARAAVSYTAVVQGPAGAPTRGARVTVRLRYTSSLGEWGKAPGTATIAVRDAAGAASADVVFGAAPTYAPGAAFHLGCDANGAGQWNGWIRTVEQSPFCWPDWRMLK